MFPFCTVLHNRIVKYHEIPLAPLVSKDGTRLRFAVLLQTVQELHGLFLVKTVHTGHPVQVEV
jgi:hypothetical protein